MMAQKAIVCSGLPKVDFWAVAEAVAVDGKNSATVAVAEAVAEGLKSWWVLICMEIWPTL